MLRSNFIQLEEVLGNNRQIQVTAANALWLTTRRTPRRAYLDPPDADETLGELLDGEGKEECDGESHGAVERDGHEDGAGGQLVARQDKDTDSGEDDDLAGHEEGGHVEATQVGAPQDLGDF